jgi:hypothetical protein
MKWILVGVALLSLGTLPARGAGFDAELSITDGKATQTTKSNAAGPEPVRYRRAVLESAATGSFTLTWKVIRSAPQPVKDVLVHFFAVKLDRQGQMPPALDPERVVIEGALTMDFAAKDTAGGTQHFQIDEPGIYLIRVDVGSDPEKPGIEDLAEVELIVK